MSATAKNKTGTIRSIKTGAICSVNPTPSKKPEPNAAKTTHAAAEITAVLLACSSTFACSGIEPERRRCCSNRRLCCLGAMCHLTMPLNPSVARTTGGENSRSPVRAVPHRGCERRRRTYFAPNEARNRAAHRLTCQAGNKHRGEGSKPRKAQRTNRGHHRQPIIVSGLPAISVVAAKVHCALGAFSEYAEC